MIEIKNRLQAINPSSRDILLIPKIKIENNVSRRVELVLYQILTPSWLIKSIPVEINKQKLRH